MGEVTELKPRSVEIQGDDKATIENLMRTVEEMDRGVKLLVGIVANHDVRLRKIELELRKALRKNVPAIVNTQGDRVN